MKNVKFLLVLSVLAISFSLAFGSFGVVGLAVHEDGHVDDGGTQPTNDPGVDCASSGGSWDGSVCNFPTTTTNDPGVDCASSGGSWDGSVCNFPTTTTYADTTPTTYSGYCGDNVCGSGETLSSCPADCGSQPSGGYCGDGFCDSGIGEDSASCASDCTSGQSGYCGDGYCNNYETTSGCPTDCGNSGSTYPTYSDSTYPTYNGGTYPTYNGGTYPTYNGGTYPTYNGGAYPTYTASVCPNSDDLRHEEDRCKRDGGAPYYDRGSDGCESVQCEYYKSGPTFPQSTCGNGICEQAEVQNGGFGGGCHDDCGVDCNNDGQNDGWDCEDFKDGRRVYEQKEFYVPEGCSQEFDKYSGFARLVCDNFEDHRSFDCPEPPRGDKERCEEGGGHYESRMLPNGCDVFDCSFSRFKKIDRSYGNDDEGGFGFGGVESCPGPEDIKEDLQRCEDFGGRGTITFEGSGFGGCNFVDCIKRDHELRKCAEDEDSAIASEIEEQCLAEGSFPVKDFDRSGCPITRCGGVSECETDVPAEAYEKCSTHGGELLVESDPTTSCITHVDCLRPGDEDDVSFDVSEIETVPEIDDLLPLVSKLVNLEVKLDKLSRKTAKVSEYYTSVGEESQADRFSQVSELLNTATANLQDIKDDLREHVENDDLTLKSMIDVKKDIRRLRKVVLKDVVFIMLGSEKRVSDYKEEVKVKYETVDTEGAVDCGGNGQCFNKAFSKCKEISAFYPDGKGQGPKVQVTGLDENGACVMRVEMPEGEGPPAFVAEAMGLPEPPYYMDCAIANYKQGVMNPDTDIFPYCEGPMLELMKAFPEGGPDDNRGPRGGDDEIERPSQCDTLDLSNDECATLIVDNFGLPPQCVGFDEETCQTLLSGAWDEAGLGY